MKLFNIFDSLISALKVFSLLTLTIIFLYWSATAIVKFKSFPTSSTVAYRFGDDGHGNIDFPAISICMDSYYWIAESLNGMKYKCRRSSSMQEKFVKKFVESLENCTATTTEGESKIYRSVTYFPNILILKDNDCDL